MKVDMTPLNTEAPNADILQKLSNTAKAEYLTSKNAYYTHNRISKERLRHLVSQKDKAELSAERSQSSQNSQQFTDMVRIFYPSKSTMSF